tara:strand:+ start:533 stop:904 length:372 start_codon:yes stop_codon:yes gene_type:complete
MFNFIKWAAILEFFRANSKILKRIIIFLSTFFILNIFYSKWETVLLNTNADALFYLLVIYSTIIFSMFIWVLFSLPFFTSFAKSKKTNEVKRSFDTRSYDYEKIRDVKKFPTLKSSNERLLED